MGASAKESDWCDCGFIAELVQARSYPIGTDEYGNFILLAFDRSRACPLYYCFKCGKALKPKSGMAVNELSASELEEAREFASRIESICDAYSVLGEPQEVREIDGPSTSIFDDGRAVVVKRMLIYERNWKTLKLAINETVAGSVFVSILFDN